MLDLQGVTLFATVRPEHASHPQPLSSIHWCHHSYGHRAAQRHPYHAWLRLKMRHPRGSVRGELCWAATMRNSSVSLRFDQARKIKLLIRPIPNHQASTSSGFALAPPYIRPEREPINQEAARAMPPRVTLKMDSCRVQLLSLPIDINGILDSRFKNADFILQS